MTILIVLLLIVTALVIIISRQPDNFTITRSAVMAANPGDIFPHVNNLQSWGPWSPWVRMDPNAVNRFEGPAAGIGATTHWVGKKTGQGSMAIIDSVPLQRIQFRLEFLKPMKATNTAEFAFTPEGTNTRVTWSMSGKSNFIGKALSLLMNCDKMVGTQFEQGLQNLKEIVEKKA